MSAKTTPPLSTLKALVTTSQGPWEIATLDPKRPVPVPLDVLLTARNQLEQMGERAKFMTGQFGEGPACLRIVGAIDASIERAKQ